MLQMLLEQVQVYLPHHWDAKMGTGDDTEVWLLLQPVLLVLLLLLHHLMMVLLLRNLHLHYHVAVLRSRSLTLIQIRHWWTRLPRPLASRSRASRRRRISATTSAQPLLLLLSSFEPSCADGEDIDADFAQSSPSDGPALESGLC